MEASSRGNLIETCVEIKLVCIEGHFVKDVLNHEYDI